MKGGVGHDRTPVWFATTCCQRQQCPVAQFLGLGNRLFELAMGVLVDLGDRAPRQDIVELVEEHRLPESLQLLPRVLGTAPGGERGESFGFLQPVLGLAVELLDPGLGSEGAPVQLQVELPDPPG